MDALELSLAPLQLPPLDEDDAAAGLLAVGAPSWLESIAGTRTQRRKEWVIV